MRNRRLSAPKRILFTVLLILVAWLVVEGFVFAAYFVVAKKAFPFSEFHAAMLAASGSAEQATDERGEGGELTMGDRWVEVIHPYLGFVQHPEKNPDRSDYGFPGGDADPFIGRGDGRLVVALFGGSFAAETFRYGRRTIEDRLEPLAGEVVLLNFAMGGYKQPQQLLTLCYLLSLGAEFDLVINLDGFNEVALPPAENVPEGVNPFFPRQWSWRVMGTIPPESIPALAELGTIDETRRKWAARFTSPVARRSMILCTIWRARDRRLEKRKAELETALKELERTSSDFALTGPPFDDADPGDLYAALVGNWSRCSSLMNDVCRSNGMDYYHFLQPNQYVEGSKPMGAEERRVAFYGGHPYRPGVVRGYPLLRRQGKELAESGIPFHDLTMVFSEISDIIYRDSCCHPNERGYRIVAEAIAGAIFAGSPAGAPSPPAPGSEH